MYVQFEKEMIGVNIEMKKWILSIALIAALMFCLTGCGSKKEISISVDGIDSYEMVEVPTNVESFLHNEDGITVTVKKDGNYDFAIKDADGKEYAFTLKYQDKKVEVSSDSDINVSASIK